MVEKWRNRLAKTWTVDIPYSAYIQQINACTVIGLRCVDSDPTKRPAAWDIIEMLNATESEDTYYGQAIGFASSCTKRPYYRHDEVIIIMRGS